MTTTLAHVRAYYDSVPYTSHAYMYSSPEQLAAVAHIFGLPAPPVASARVLELGGASGGNLIPLALRYPELKALELDLSPVQIDLGARHADRLGLDNILLRQADLAEVDSESLGEFDYIICHGVYSWVPPHVQDALLRICSRNLAPDGVAYVSYNTYPGWKAKEMIRDAMLLHGSTRSDPKEQIAYARGMVGFLQQVARKEGMLARALEENLPYLRKGDDHYLAHEYLEPYNLPCYFHQFLERATGHGLSYLGEAQPAMMIPGNYGNDIAEPLLRAFGHDQARMEQYLDFAINRGFRQTLLVHASRAGDIRYRLDRQRLQSVHFAARLPCAAGDSRFDGSIQEYGTKGEPSVSTSSDAVKRALDLLTQAWPMTIGRNELVGGVEASLDPSRAPPRDLVEAAIDELLEFLILRGTARIRLAPVLASADTSTPHPRVDPLVRRMTAALEGEGSYVANAWHESIELSPVERALYPSMDGSLDREGLIRLLVDKRSAVNASGDVAREASSDVERMLARLPEQAVLLP
ncbi:MAG: methyltransferase regulatory domain-containing protein [Pseudoxanthomonas sp.]